MSSHRVVPPPPPPPPPLPDRTGAPMADGSFSGIPPPKPKPSQTQGSANIQTSNSSTSESINSNTDKANSIHNANQERSPGSIRSRNPGTRIPPPPPPQPPPRKIPPPPPPRRSNGTKSKTATASTQQRRRRPIHPPPPPPPPPRGMSLDSSEELASKAKDMLHKCLNRSIPTGNLYSGGLGAYYLLLEQSRYHSLLLERQKQQRVLSGIRSNNHHHTSSAAPFRCKKLLKQALEGAQSATGRFKRSNSSNLSNQRSNISLLGGEWVGCHVLLAVCYRRLEDFAKMHEQSGDDQSKASLLRGPRSTKDWGKTENSSGSNGRSTAMSPSGMSLFSKRRAASSSGASVSSTGGASMVSEATIATTNPRPRSQRVVDKILNRLERQHRASDEDDDNLTYYTLNSNYTSNTLSSMVIATVWNQDIMGGRAGALQAIWWLRKEFGDVTLGQELVVSLAVKILVEGLSTAASMGLNNHEKADDSSDADSTRNSNNDSCYSYCESDILFWVCDSQGSHKTYLGASRGVVGILYTLLGLSNKDWELVEEQTPNARGCVRNTIDVFLSERNSSTGSPIDEDEGISVPDHTQQELEEKEDPVDTRTRLDLLHERFVYSNINDKNTGNLRPRLDASEESDTTVDWFHGATGLAMLFLEASKIFRCKKYLQEAHRLCDTVIFPRGLAEQQKNSSQGGQSSFRSRRVVDATNKKGPVGLAGMAICFLQLSRLCSNEIPANPPAEVRGEEATNRALSGSEKLLSKTTSLQNMWKTRAAIYAQHAHQEWTNYMKVIPTANGTGNAYSLYEGMGSLISLFWQLSLSTFPNSEDGDSSKIGVQMPLYGLGFDDSNDDTISEENDLEPILLSYGDVTLSETPLRMLRPKTPIKTRRLGQAAPRVGPSKEALAEARKRRAAAEAEARKRTALAEEAKKAKDEQEKVAQALRNAQRKAELEARKKARLLARKKALEVAKQREEEESINKAKKEAEDKCKREALLLARKQAKERVEARRKEKEAEELAKARAEAQRKAVEAENKRKVAEEEKKKRKALAEARLLRQKKEAQAAQQQEAERKRKDEADRLRRAEELKEKEKQRKQRLAESRRRQQRAAEIAKEKEKKRLLREEAERVRREKELKIKEAERKKQDEERRRRLAILRERKKKEEERLAQQNALEQEELKLAARKAMEAKEKRRLQLREERLKKKKELEDERLRRELQQALDKEAEKQQREERILQEADEQRKIQEAINAINSIDKFEGSVPPEASPPPKSTPVYSPSFAERKKSLNPAHFSVQTRSSLFWSLQTDSKIGSSENYRPALIAADSTPSSAAISTTQEETS